MNYISFKYYFMNKRKIRLILIALVVIMALMNIGFGTFPNLHVWKISGLCGMALMLFGAFFWGVIRKVGDILEWFIHGALLTAFTVLSLQLPKIGVIILDYFKIEDGILLMAYLILSCLYMLGTAALAMWLLWYLSTLKR